MVNLSAVDTYDLCRPVRVNVTDKTDCIEMRYWSRGFWHCRVQCLLSRCDLSMTKLVAIKRVIISRILVLSKKKGLPLISHSTTLLLILTLLADMTAMSHP